MPESMVMFLVFVGALVVIGVIGAIVSTSREQSRKRSHPTYVTNVDRSDREDRQPTVNRRSGMSIYPSVDLDNKIVAESMSTGKPVSRVVCDILTKHYAEVASASQPASEQVEPSSVEPPSTPTILRASVPPPDVLNVSVDDDVTPVPKKSTCSADDIRLVKSLSPGAQHNLSYVLFRRCRWRHRYISNLRHDEGRSDLLASGIVKYAPMPRPERTGIFSRDELNELLSASGIDGFKKNMSQANLVQWIKDNHPDFVYTFSNNERYYYLAENVLWDEEKTLEYLDSMYQNGDFDHLSDG